MILWNRTQQCTMTLHAHILIPNLLVQACLSYIGTVAEQIGTHRTSLTQVALHTFLSRTTVYFHYSNYENVMDDVLLSEARMTVYICIYG